MGSDTKVYDVTITMRLMFKNGLRISIRSQSEHMNFDEGCTIIKHVETLFL